MREDSCHLSLIPWETLYDFLLPYLDIVSLRQLSLTHSYFYQLVVSYIPCARGILFTENTRKVLKEQHLLKLWGLTGNLQYIDLSEMRDAVTDSTLKTLINRNHKLRLLNVSKCGKIGPKAFELDLDSTVDSRPLGRLEVLIANWCRMLRPDFLVHVSHAPLRVISLAGTWYTSDQAVSDCATFFRDTLECLNVDKCYKITDSSISRLALCSNLRILKISSCWRVTDTSINSIVKSCSELQQVAIDDCRSISKNLLVELNDKGVLLLEAAKSDAAVRWDSSQSYLKPFFRF